MQIQCPMKPTFIALICIVGVLRSIAQPIKPTVFLSQRELTADGGQPYDQFYWLNSNSASLTKTGVSFPQTGSYRFDISAYKVAGDPQLNVLIDGIIENTISINASSASLYSVVINEIDAGSHTISIQLKNFSAGSNHCRVGLLYFTKSASPIPYVFPDITSNSLPTSNQYVTADHFKSKLLRGFNLSSIHTLSQLAAKDLPAARATGANLGRYWISVSHAANSSEYYFSNRSGTNLGLTPLETLDSAIRIAEKIGMYLIITLQVFPDQAECDLWGDDAGAISRRNGLKTIWQQIAARYKDKTIVAGYDLINEPRSNFNYAEYLRWQSDMVEAIRSIDPNHVIAIEVLENTMLGQMQPLPYENLIYSPHGYSPLRLTHQGVNPYAGSTAEQSRAAYPSERDEENYFYNSSYWKVPIEFSKKYNVPIWIGEFSCVNWAPKNSLGEWTSTRWIDDAIKVFEAESLSWCYHAWREWQAWDAEIPSSYYDSYTFTNGAPFTAGTRPSGWSSSRTSTAPTIVMLKKWFGLNASATENNTPPTVNVITPEANTAYDTTQFIVVDVQAIDTDGSIQKVELYNHDTLVASKTASPYSFEIHNLVAGTYELKVKAYDNGGEVTTSSSVPVTVSNLLFTVLPVKLEYFKVTSFEDGELRLQWSTNNELHTSYFEIQYLDKNNDTWIKLGEVMAANLSAQKRDYVFIGQLQAGSYQVRIKQIFKDGNFSYSGIKHISAKEPDARLFSYASQSRKIFINGTGTGSYHLRLIDLGGKALFSTRISAYSEINMPSVSPGIYVLSVYGSNGEFETHKIFIPQ